ncbi:MAG: P-loop NTPase fold protein [[Ruminococcus] torques]
MALQDKIGREEIVDKICGLVGSLKKDKNFCLAINGAWGSGKSFVLGLIEEKLSKKQEYIIIKYDAWENTFYSDPLIAILSCVLDGLEDKLSKMKGYGKVAADFGKKKGKEIVDKLSESGGKIGFIAKIIKEISELIPDLKNVSLVTDTKDNQLAIFKSYKALLNQVKGLLNKLTEKVLVSNQQTTLVILVDEIDRCLPDEQLKILERLHHLFDVKNCAVIVTMNQICVAETVKTIYGIDGYEYLRKFFSFTFRLDTSANEYLKNLFEEYIKSFEKIQIPENEVKHSVELAYQCLLYGSEKALDKADNRELTRYLECVTNVCNDFGWQKLNPYYVFFVLLALYIRKIISPTFLNSNEIVANQNSISEKYKNLSNLLSDEQQDAMPYYDYLAEFLGVDRRDPPEEFSHLYQWDGGQIREFSWAFNETVNFSMRQQFIHKIHGFYDRSMVKPDACKELRRLIILYGGEQERCEK